MVLNQKYCDKFRINSCGHFKTNSEHEILKSTEVCYSSEENDKQTITIQHKSKLQLQYKLQFRVKFG